jgi:hypothetical protein
MHQEHLSSTESHAVDLIALRAWHWRASTDPNRDHEMRCWHRDQCKWISLRLSAHRTDKTTPATIATIELLADAAAEDLHREVETLYAGDWEKNCQLAREAILAKLRRDPRLKQQAEPHEP